MRRFRNRRHASTYFNRKCDHIIANSKKADAVI